MNQAFCILAAGRGSRLGDLTASINKALLPIDNKAAISHIIEKAPADCEIVIAVGYDKEKVQEYCRAAHPERSFIFVEVDKLEGPGSGPGYSLLCCEPHLRRPFYLCNVDTLVEQPYRDLDVDWIGIANTLQPQMFATVEHCMCSYVSQLSDKGEGAVYKDHLDRDYAYAYIGLAGIKNWDVFLTALRSTVVGSGEVQYIPALQALIKEHGEGGLGVYGYTWYDTGSVQGYQETCEKLSSGQVLGMEKTINELTYKVGNQLIKLCWDSEKNRKRLARAEQLQELIPSISYRGTYTMAYVWEDGQSLYEVKDLGVWRRFLDWCNSYLWSDRSGLAYDVEKACRSFYRDKTWDRLHRFMQAKGWEQCPRLMINGLECEPIDSYLTCLRWWWICHADPARIHGDLQFDNAVLCSREYHPTNAFKLIDWRECFGPLVEYGDLYYDLAKLYMGVDLPYDVLKRKEIELDWTGDQVTYEIPVSSTIQSFRISYEDWLRERNYDVRKVQVLSALTQLNMAPLHPSPMGDVLYAHANLRLAQLT